MITCSITTLTYSRDEQSHSFLMVDGTKSTILLYNKALPLPFSMFYKPFKYRYVLRPFLRNCHLAQEEDPPQGTKVWGENRRV